MTGTVTLHATGEAAIAEVVLHNPGKLNAMSVAMWQALRQTFEHLHQSPDVRVIVVRGAHGQFASGGDIEEFPWFRFQADTLAHFHEQVVLPALQAMLDCDLPVIAHIEGACVGGGLEIAACCDLRLAARSSRFGIPIARLGFPLAPAELEIVQRVVGATVLRELLIEARVLDADNALARGLVTRVRGDDELAAHVIETAQHIATLSPQALRLNKQALRALGQPPFSSADDRERCYAYADSAEHREGLAAFNERRAARFGN
jgi:enoyl-CoA hydratase